MSRNTLISTLLSLAVLGSACTILEPDAEQIDDLDAEIGLMVSENGIPSLAVLVAKNDAIVWERYYGYADVGDQLPADASTIYVLASVSKLAVVTAVMQHVERGLLDLDDEASTHLPFVVRNPTYPDDAITLRHLLTHSSGLAWPVDGRVVPGFYELYPMDSAPPLGQWLPEVILPSGSQYVPAVWKDFRPGEKELYSNIGVALLAYAVEMVSGIDFAEYCKQNIFEPLDMPNTSYRYADLNMSQVATSYSTPSRVIPPYGFMSYPSGELKSSAQDFSHFLIAYMNGGAYRGTRILSETSVDEILTMHNSISGLCLIWNRTLGEWYGHAGGKPGVSAYAEFQRERKVALVVMSNMRHASLYPGKRIHALARRVASEF